MALVAGSLLLTNISVSADSKRLVEPATEHKKKSTIDTFPFPQMEQDDLAQAVIEGGLEPPAAGGATAGEKSASKSDAKIGLDERDRRTDFDYQTTSVKFNFRMPRYTPPGTTVLQATEFNKSNRTYIGPQDVGTTGVR